MVNMYNYTYKGNNWKAMDYACACKNCQPLPVIEMAPAFRTIDQDKGNSYIQISTGCLLCNCMDLSRHAKGVA